MNYADIQFPYNIAIGLAFCVLYFFSIAIVFVAYNEGKKLKKTNKIKDKLISLLIYLIGGSMLAFVMLSYLLPFIIGQNIGIGATIAVTILVVPFLVGYILGK